MIRAKGLDLTAFGLDEFEFYDEATEAIAKENEINITRLNNDLNALNNSLIDLKMLGWSVPADCPIQNSVSGNTFTQRVGRVDLGSLSYSRQGSGSVYYFHAQLNPASVSATENAYTKDYTVTSLYGWANLPNKYYRIGGDFFRIRDDNYTDATAFKNAMQGQYLYYELATPITYTIDGNEAVERLNTSLDDYGLVNQFDGVLYQKYLSSEGTESYSEDTHAVCSGYLSCEANDIVSIKCKHNYTDTRICFYDSNKNFISKLDNGVVQGKAPSNAKYYRFHFWNESEILVGNAKDKIFAYINNEIEGLKADLNVIEFSSLPTDISHISVGMHPCQFNGGLVIGSVTLPITVRGILMKSSANTIHAFVNDASADINSYSITFNSNNNAWRCKKIS